MSEHKAKNLGNGEYEYRGCVIVREDGVAVGRLGRWTVVRGPKGCRRRAESMATAMRHIDRVLDAAPAAKPD